MPTLHGTYPRHVSVAVVEKPPAAPVIAIAVTLVLWASAFVAIRHLGDYFGPGPLTLGRMAVGSVCLGAVVAVQARRTGAFVTPGRRDWMPIIAIGVLWYAVYMVALNAGEKRVDAGTAAMLLQVSPILVAVGAAWFLSERFTPALAIGMVVSFAGVVVIGFADGGGASDLIGGLLCVVAALAYSVSLVLQKPLVGRLPALTVTWLACTVGAVVCLGFGPGLVDELADAPTAAIVWMVYLGVFPTAVAFTTYAFALQHMTASKLGVTTYVVPVITIVMAWVFLSEAPPMAAYAGGALALLGVAIARRG